MGEALIKKFRLLGKEYKIAFISAFVIGLVVHLFMFTNKLPNHDYVYNIYSNQFDWPISIGRCFLSVAAGLSSYFTLPWLNGILSILYLSLISCFIVSIFNIRKAIPIILTSSLIVAFPSFTDTVGYMFLVDGFMLGFLISVIGVWFWAKYDNIRGIIACVICLAFAAGVYQSYVSFAICLILIRLILDIIENNMNLKKIVLKGVRALISGILGMGLYYASLKFIMMISGTSFSDYMGVNEVSLPSFGVFLTTLGKDIVAFAEMFIGGNSSFTTYEVLNIIFIIALVSSVIFAIIKQKLYKTPGKLILLIVLAFLFIPGAYIFDFISDEVVYRFMMLYSLVLLYILLIKIADDYMKPIFSNSIAVLITIITFNFAVIDNIAYLNLDYCWEQTMATATIMEDRIASLPDFSKEMSLAAFGSMQDEGRDWIISKLPESMIGINDVNLNRNQDFIYTILSKDLGFTLGDKACQEEKDIIKASFDIDSMPCWPNDGSVAEYDNYVIIKLSEDY